MSYVAFGQPCSENEGFNIDTGRCEPICRPDQSFSKEEGACVCKSGTVDTATECEPMPVHEVEPVIIVGTRPQPTPVTSPPAAISAPGPARAIMPIMIGTGAIVGIFMI